MSFHPRDNKGDLTDHQIVFHFEGRAKIRVGFQCRAQDGAPPVGALTAF